MTSDIFVIGFLLSAIRLATPLVFTSFGGLYSERAGVINIALEGLMLCGAFSSAAIAYTFHSTTLGWIAAFVVGALAALFYGIFTVWNRSDQIVSGMAFNILVMGLIPLLNKGFYGSTGSTPNIDIELRPGMWPYFLALLLVPATHFFLQNTRGGLNLRMAGESPLSLTTSGVSLTKVRMLSLLMCGGLAGWGGATLAIVLGSSYSPLMSGGRGFMSLAALIFGKWRPIPTCIACLFFGAAEALQIRLQGVALGGVVVPVQLLQALPYIITICALAGFVGKSTPPKALGNVDLGH